MAKPSMPLIKLNTSATVLASIKQEPLTSPSFPPHPVPIPQPLAVVKTEPEQPEQQQPPPPPPTQPQQQQPQKEEQQQRREPQFLKSITDLLSLSSAINAFKCRFDELTKHLDFINQAIDSKFNEPQQEQQRPQIETDTPSKSTENDSKTEKKGPETASLPKASRSEIQCLCEMMCSKGLRKYIVTHLSDVSNLREQVPAALELAPKPDKLVLDCIGRFFLQGIKAYTKDSPMIPARQASVLVLEFFLLMMRDFRGKGQFKIAADLKVEAEKGAAAWRKRLISEGGLAKACEVDARGLLLFVACFGIPKVFRSEDLGNLLRLCNLRAISDALKGSPVLPDKMPAIIEAMVKNGMHVEAVDVASIFGLEDKFSPKSILTLFLQESTKAFKMAKQEAQNSSVALIKANEKQLDALKSIVHYLEDGNNDVTKLLAAWQIEEKIVKLEEEIAELNKRIEDKKIIPKRKLDEMGSSSRVKSQEMKRSRFAAKGSPLLKSSHINGLHEQRTATFAEGVRSYDSLVSNSYYTAISGNVTNHPSAVPQGSTIGSLPENGVGQKVGITGVGSSGMVASIGVMSASSYSGAHGVINPQMISSSGLSNGWQQGSVGQSASMRFGGFFGSSPSVEGFVGVPDATDRSPADLYRFADSIGGNEFYSSSYRTGTLPTDAPVSHSSYMY
ncbi:protein FRIGIDA-like [Durio zibethinus]|uniref:FRIGIDA-like protein n=1 Tax=Durio zibethinus TaxID=66656 RepID=A0A6P6B2G1_DURZI|nr:protein FRIGIDA-like [Durio zibethinus]